MLFSWRCLGLLLEANKTRKATLILQLNLIKANIKLSWIWFVLKMN